MHPEETDNKSKKAMAIVAVLLVTVLVVVGVKAFAPKKSDAMNPDGNAGSVTPSSSSTSSNAAAYKDGTYTADGGYQSPGGAESIKVRITIKNNAVVDSSVTSNVATDEDAQQFQGDFIDGYKTLVVGKNVNDIHVSRVSGSSLTSEGFNNALAQIKDQAKA
jgi:uncharacterized protein with FMN-binding domain